MDNKQGFKWTDELVKEFADNVPVDEMANNTHIEQFKKSKEHKVEEKRTEVISLTYCGSNGKAFGFQDEIYYFVVNQKIPQERYEAVKQAIERELNKGEVDIPSDAKDFEVFSIKGEQAFIGFKISNGNFHFIGVPYTDKQAIKESLNNEPLSDSMRIIPELECAAMDYSVERIEKYSCPVTAQSDVMSAYIAGALKFNPFSDSIPTLDVNTKDKMAIKFIETDSEFLEANASRYEDWYYMPHWFQKIKHGIYKIYSLAELPERLKEDLLQLRGEQPIPENKPQESKQDSKTRQMWNKHTGIHDESVLCTGMKCQEYNPLNKEHKI